MHTISSDNYSKLHQSKCDMQVEAIKQLDSIKRAESLARARHDIDLNILKLMEENNRLTVDCSKIKQLVRSGDTELCSLKYDIDILNLDTSIELKKEEAKQLNAEYKLSIELPSKLKSQSIKKIALAKFNRIIAETTAQVQSIELIEQARIKYNNEWRLAEARGVRKVAEAMQYYYKALIIDRLSAYILDVVAFKYNIDPSFRFRLERPLRISMNQFNQTRLKAISSTGNV